jgi:hypothetical protein
MLELYSNARYRIFLLITLYHYGNVGFVMNINTNTDSSFKAQEMYGKMHGKGIFLRYNLFIFIAFPI